jgi:hypothetical protein
MKKFYSKPLWIVTILIFACHPKAVEENNQSPSSETTNPFYIEKKHLLQKETLCYAQKIMVKPGRMYPTTCPLTFRFRFWKEKNQR